MKEGSQIYGTLLDYIWKCGAMDGLSNDDSRVQRGYSVLDFLCQ